MLNWQYARMRMVKVTNNAYNNSNQIQKIEENRSSQKLNNFQILHAQSVSYS